MVLTIAVECRMIKKYWTHPSHGFRNVIMTTDLEGKTVSKGKVHPLVGKTQIGPE